MIFESFDHGIVVDLIVVDVNVFGLLMIGSWIIAVVVVVDKHMGRGVILYDVLKLQCNFPIVIIFTQGT